MIFKQNSGLICLQKRFRFPDQMPVTYQAYEAKNLDLKTLVVKNLPRNMNADELASIFDDYGLVKRCQVKFTEQREYHNYGSVEICAKGAERAIEDLKTTLIRGNILSIEIIQNDKQKSSFTVKPYTQMDKPDTRAKWKGQAERWENTFRPKNTGPTPSLKGLTNTELMKLKSKKSPIQSTIIEKPKKHQ